MIQKTYQASVFFLLSILGSSCVCSKVEHFRNYTANPSRPPMFARNAIEEYFSLSWEPYLWVLSVGIIPQYHYAVYKRGPADFEKRSEIAGWIALGLPLVSTWKYGDIHDRNKPKPYQADEGKSPVRVPYRSSGAIGQ